MSISKSIFKINTASGTGTGFFIKDNNIVVTNFHVVEGNREIAVEDYKKDRYLASVVMVNPETDIAFLKFTDAKFNAAGILINDSNTINSKDKVYVHGYPFGMPYTVTEGIVSSPNQLMEGRNYIQTDAAVNPGNSGGPILNANDELVAITTSKFTNADNVGFGIPLETLLKELAIFNNNDAAVFSVKCQSCDSFVKEKLEYCNNCGNKIHDKAFDEYKLSEIGIFVEDTLKITGINPILARVGYEYWEYHHGSSLIRIFVFENKYLFATSPLNNLPKTGLEEFYNYILADNVAPFKLAVYKNQLFLSYRVHLSEVLSKEKSEKVKKNLAQLPDKADDLDDFFVNEYGCEMSQFSKEVP